MTAEIAVMNKLAVALAADSAVTIGGGRVAKIYQSANKLFMLSKYHPVGIMVYGNGELNAVPWELIIKVFRSYIGEKRFDYLQQYADAFIQFLDQENHLFPLDSQVRAFGSLTATYFDLILDEIDDDIEEYIDEAVTSGKKVNDSDTQKIASNIINKYHKKLKDRDTLPTFPNNHISSVKQNYHDIIQRAIKEIFEKLPLNKRTYSKLIDIAACLSCKDLFSPYYSGVVIAGFGEKEYFPSLIQFRMELIVNNKLKYICQKPTEISFKTPIVIKAFAQSDVIRTFMDGIDPDYEDALYMALEKLFTAYPIYLVDNLPNLSNKQKENYLKKIIEINKNLLDEFRQDLEYYKYNTNVIPVIDAIEALPKDELASVAESLVNLTSFKRKFSMSAESVGGPIDVALISKGDGFIWIKRKHYFQPELNNHYFANYYYRENGSDKNGKHK